MHSAFNLLVFPNSMFHRCCCCFFYWKGYVLSGEIALKNNHYYYYVSWDEYAQGMSRGAEVYNWV